MRRNGFRGSSALKIVIKAIGVVGFAAFALTGPLPFTDSVAVWSQDNQQNMPPADEALDPGAPRRGRGAISQRGRQAPEFRRVFQPLADTHAASVVGIDVDGQQVALGTIVSADGRIVTKSSQVPDEVQLRLADGRRGIAQVVVRDEQRDLALLQSELREITPIDWNKIGSVSAGDFVVTLGAQGDVRWIGVAETAPREFRVRRGRNNNRSRGGTGGGFLGVQTAQLENGGGVEITQVIPNSAALRAGLRPGDRMTHIAGTPVESPEQLITILSARKPGEEVEIRVQRDDTEVSVIAKLGAQQNATAQLDQWGGGPFSERRFGFPPVIPHDTPLPPNECGGPVVNSRGEIVGINISRALRVATYALPIDDVRSFVQDHTE